jgi:hypothetical protein
MPGHLQLVPNPRPAEERCHPTRHLELPRSGWHMIPLGQLEHTDGKTELVLRPLPHGDFQLVATPLQDDKPRVRRLVLAETLLLLDPTGREWAIDETRGAAAQLACIAASALARGACAESGCAEQVALRLERAAALLREVAALDPGPAPRAA